MVLRETMEIIMSAHCSPISKQTSKLLNAYVCNYVWNLSCSL